MIPPFTSKPFVVKKELLLARETLELACLLSIRSKDTLSFERHVAQLKPFYYDPVYTQLVGDSERKWLILGLYLLGLLAQSHFAEFHTELELIPIHLHSNMYIKHVMDLEQYLMEGSYYNLNIAREKVPAHEYLVFMDILMETVREEIADCSEKAYHHLKLSDAQKILFLKTESELNEFVLKRKWKVEQGVIRFDETIVASQSFEESSKQLISKTLLYAKEMERIIWFY